MGFRAGYGGVNVGLDVGLESLVIAAGWTADRWDGRRELRWAEEERQEDVGEEDSPEQRLEGR